MGDSQRSVRVAGDPLGDRSANRGRNGGRMAHILEFRSSNARSEPHADTVQGGGAQIIIFPGVRRERHVEEPPKSRRRERRTKRDRLELPD